MSYNNRGLLIIGTSGAGKSALALQLMALGCDLISDDRTFLNLKNGHLFASSPSEIKGKIEARFIGVLEADSATEAQVVAMVDLDQIETNRLPPQRQREVGGCMISVFHNVVHSYFPAALLQYLKGTRIS